MTRRTNGRYLLSKLCPVLHVIMGTDQCEVWPEHGDPMIAEICAFSAERLLGERLKPLEMVQTIVTITRVAGPSGGPKS